MYNFSVWEIYYIYYKCIMIVIVYFIFSKISEDINFGNGI